MSLLYSRRVPQLTAALAILALAACGDSTTAPGGESELISRVTVSVTGNGSTQSAFIDDSDGNGPIAPSPQSGTLVLQRGVTYTGTILFENRLENPPENITTEVLAEADEHRVFYTPGTGTTVTVTDTDTQGRPLGLRYSIVAGSGASGSGSLRTLLCHYAGNTKPAVATSCTFDTDIDVLFAYSVQTPTLTATK